jgi:hypothetical protein
MKPLGELIMKNEKLKIKKYTPFTQKNFTTEIHHRKFLQGAGI